MAAKENMIETPLMKQYFAIKAKYPDTLLLFRVGDFYETFGEDAIKTASTLGIVLTHRNNGNVAVELAGFPHHALDTYLPKLVKAGFRVAICDQLEDPKMTKTIVKRGVTEIVTPGISFSDKILDHKTNNYLCGVYFTSPAVVGVSFLDVSTAEFFVAQGNEEYADKLLQSLRPSEVIVPKNRKNEFCRLFGDKFYLNTLEDWVYSSEYANDVLLKQFQTKSLKGFGIDLMESAIPAAASVIQYLHDTQHNQLGHISSISRLEEDRYVWLDRFTIRNLELISSPHEDAKTLLDIIDHTASPMGARLMKRWLVLPLKDVAPIKERHDVVDYFIGHSELAETLEKEVHLMGDLERLISKVAVARVNPREVVHIKKALTSIATVRESLAASDFAPLKKISDSLNPCPFICERIGKELVADPPMMLNKGGVIADGVSEELDELRKLAFSGKDYLMQIQQRESERTGISSLKVAFNNVFGYYIEVRNTHKDKVPTEWIRKQTLVSAERYITEELKHYEEKILGAEEKILALETKMFNELVLSLVDYIQPVQLNASLVARIDCLLSFASIARRYGYVRPEINEGFELDIKKGRHPVIEQQLPPDQPYISNDVFLDNQKQQIIIITGPNMSGKSALLRQTALIVLLAQMGSFVPAESASIGIVDKIFTRVGASDNISSGESTFMVEMTETASILNNLSNRSLILLDEIGRGTSTYDGISIAWSIAEYIHEHPACRAKTLFATHYHEMNEMANTFRRIRNYNVSIREIDDKIIFLRKLVPGGSNHSFGIHVAAMAGIPEKVIQRANEVLKQLERDHSSELSTGTQPEKKADTDGLQLSFIQLNDPILEEIRDEIMKTDINTLTPVEALLKLSGIQKLVSGKEKKGK
ncbi:MAG: DNA mismatch repair protein MutS [Bacteroidota bacterium]